MPLQRQAGFIYDNPSATLIAHELAHGAFNLRHTFSTEDNTFIAAQNTTDNLMDYKGGTELWMHQWKKIQSPDRVWLSFLEGEEEGEAKAEKKYHLTIDGKKAIEIDMQAMETEFDETRKLSNDALNNYPFKTIQIFVLGSEKNDFKVSTSYVKNGKDAGIASEIVWDINGSKETGVSFPSIAWMKDIYMYYTNADATYPIYKIELVRVTPNIACKQEDKVDYLIRKDKQYNITNEIELSGSKVSLRPVFFTFAEESNNVSDISVLSEKDHACSYLVDSIKFEDKQYDPILDWVEYSISAASSTYQIITGDKSTKGIIRNVKSPFVTVKRGVNNKETGYYIEDYYSLKNTEPASLREQKNTITKVDIDGLNEQYYIPIIHYKTPRQVTLLLSDIDKSQNSNTITYRIKDKQVSLNEEFTIHTESHGTVLEIKDMQGNIKGKIEFRQIAESPISCTLNIVTIDYAVMPADFSEIIADLNSIYNTMNVNWQPGKHINLTTDEKTNVNNDDKIFGALQNYKDNENKKVYKSTEYYMIYKSMDEDKGGYTKGFGKNYIFVNKDMSSSTRLENHVAAHELGHCNGLNEVAIDIGINAGNSAEGSDMQYQSTNVMGYRHMSDPPTLDFYSWQIPLLLESIKNRK
jgi:hypothetical protein